MNCAFRWRVLVLAVSLGIVCGGANRALAQTEPATDLATRIDSLEKQLADLKSQMEAQKAAAAPAPVPAAAAAALPPPRRLPPRQPDWLDSWDQPR